MTAAWSRAAPSLSSSNGDPLPKFDESVKDKYSEAIKKALSKTTTSTRRLEGELDDGLGRKTVFLFLARDAVGQVDASGDVTLHDLLVLKRRRFSPGRARPRAAFPSTTAPHMEIQNEHRTQNQ